VAGHASSTPSSPRLTAAAPRDDTRMTRWGDTRSGKVIAVENECSHNEPHLHRDGQPGAPRRSETPKRLELR
jgi:hypothetical protein